MDTKFTLLWIATILGTIVICWIVFNYHHDKQSQYVELLEETLETRDTVIENQRYTLDWYKQRLLTRTTEFDEAIEVLRQNGLLQPDAQ